MISHSKINLPFDIAAAQAEIGCLAAANWKLHFNTVNYQGEWTVLSLRSPGGSMDNIIPDLMNNGAYADTPLMTECPAIKQLIGSMQCEILSARLLNLKKGAVIKEHRDVELAFENGEARLHFPIFTNQGVAFYVNDERVTMHEGDCWYINANLKHRVVNNGDTDRIHLVIDCKVNQWLESIFENAEKNYAPETDDPKTRKLMIEALRNMGTETALAMADKMEEINRLDYFANFD
jgi:mannose-6-phosphate isomerase-like protein (cupin superfamily)